MHPLAWLFAEYNCTEGCVSIGEGAEPGECVSQEERPMSVDIRQISVFMAGFFVGAMVAHVVAPGSVAMWVATGMAVGLFSSAYFAETNGANAFWPFGRLISNTPTATPSTSKTSHEGFSSAMMATRSADRRKPRQRSGSRGSHPRRKHERRQGNHVVCRQLPSRLPHRPTVS